MLPVIWRAVFIERPRRNARSFTLYKHFFKIKPLLRQQERLKTNAPRIHQYVQNIVYHLRAATASRTHVLLLAVIFILIFTYIEEKGDIICQVKLNAAPFTSVCLLQNR